VLECVSALQLWACLLDLRPRGVVYPSPLHVPVRVLLIVNQNHSSICPCLPWRSTPPLPLATGKDVTCLAFGASRSGKTYSLWGTEDGQSLGRSVCLFVCQSISQVTQSRANAKPKAASHSLRHAPSPREASRDAPAPQTSKSHQFSFSHHKTQPVRTPRLGMPTWASSLASSPRRCTRCGDDNDERGRRKDGWVDGLLT